MLCINEYDPGQANCSHLLYLCTTVCLLDNVDVFAHLILTHTTSTSQIFFCRYFWENLGDEGCWNGQIFNTFLCVEFNYLSVHLTESHSYFLFSLSFLPLSFSGTQEHLAAGSECFWHCSDHDRLLCTCALHYSWKSQTQPLDGAKASILCADLFHSIEHVISSVIWVVNCSGIFGASILFSTCIFFI